MDDASRAKLWNQYKVERSIELREQIILEYAPLVKIVAGKLSMYLGAHVEYEELVSFGIFGLIDAIDKFDMTKEVKFETYASLRIRGAILDQIRKMDWIPRTIRQKQKKMDIAIQELESENGTTASKEQIIERLNITEEEYDTWESQIKVSNIVSLDEFVEQGIEVNAEKHATPVFESPEEAVYNNELKEMIMQSLENLTEKEKKVILLYYYEDLTLKEISRVLEVTESRVSQLHTKALTKMKGKLGSYMGIMN